MPFYQNPVLLLSRLVPGHVRASVFMAARMCFYASVACQHVCQYAHMHMCEMVVAKLRNVVASWE